MNSSRPSSFCETTDVSKLIKCVFPLVLALSWGCSGPEGLEDGGLEAQKGRFGLVSVSYDHDWSDSGQALLLTSTAQFVSYTAMDRDQVARVLALPLDPESDLPSPESCKRYDLSVELFTDEVDPNKPRNVELLEAGDLRIQTEEGKLVVLAPRHFSWLLPFISGVVYGESQAMLVMLSNAGLGDSPSPLNLNGTDGAFFSLEGVLR